MSQYIKFNHETEFELLTISHGRFSSAGNFMGVCLEKPIEYPPLHVYNAQLKFFGWERKPQLPFFAIGKWKEIANKPGEFRFTALSIWKSKEDCEKALKLDKELDHLVYEAIEKKKREIDM
jgi:hypothetical protein